MVAAGIGSALVPRLAIDRGIRGVVTLDASRRVPARQIGLVWHRDATLPEAAEDFVAAVRARCDELTELLKLPPYEATGAIEEDDLCGRNADGRGRLPRTERLIRAATRRLVGAGRPVGVLRGWRDDRPSSARSTSTPSRGSCRGRDDPAQEPDVPVTEEGGVDAVQRWFESSTA